MEVVALPMADIWCKYIGCWSHCQELLNLATPQHFKQCFHMCVWVACTYACVSAFTEINVNCRKWSLVYVFPCVVYLNCRTKQLLLKLPSLFAAWPFWTFHTKSHNMKALVILIHSWSPFLPLICLYGENELIVVLCTPSGVFSWEKTPLRLPMQITWQWSPLGRFCYGLNTVRQKKMWT